MVKADKDKAFEQEALFAGVEELREEYKQQCIDNSVAYNFIKKKPGLHFSFGIKILKQISRSGPQLIFLHGSSKIIPAKMAAVFSKGRKRIIVRETQANALKTKKDWMGLTLALIFANKVVFLTDNYNAEVKKKLAWVYREKKVVVIPNGIDLDLHKPLEKTASAEILIGMVGRIVMIKDHISLLKAIALVKQENPQVNIKLKIAGDGAYKQLLEREVSAMKIEEQVEFTGMLDQNELLHFIQSLDIYVHASLGETMSTAIMQAMACKKPIIASDVPGINNMIIDNSNGLLVPVKDPAAIASAILRLTGDPVLASQLAEGAYRFAVNNYSNTVMFDRYKQLFNS
jgi:glycosyltransferase involved in cell wall biosynthesis